MRKPESSDERKCGRAKGINDIKNIAQDLQKNDYRKYLMTRKNKRWQKQSISFAKLIAIQGSLPSVSKSLSIKKLFPYLQ
jgi:hypothetical protein